MVPVDAPEGGEADRRAVEDAERLRTLLDLHPDGVFSVDLDGRFTAVNARALEQSGGYTEAELSRMTFVDLLHPEDAPAVVREFGRVAAGEPRNLDVRFRRKDGLDGQLELQGLPVTVDGEVVGVFAVARDLAPRLAAEQALDDARRGAEAAALAKSQFLAMISHEIRTPLTSLLASAEVLGDSPLDTAQQRLLERINRSGARLLRLLDDLLDFARLEAGRTTLVSEPFVLGDVVEEAQDVMSGWARDKGLDFDLTAQGLPGVPLLGDPGRITQVLTNLVSNAVKFTHEGAVRVSVEADDGPDAGPASGSPVVVTVTVADTGIGLTAEQQEIVFDTFTQGEATTSREYGGTGLGLAICRELVTLMGGTIDVASSPGSGSTFTVRLPLDPAP